MSLPLWGETRIPQPSTCNVYLVTDDFHNAVVGGSIGVLSLRPPHWPCGMDIEERCLVYYGMDGIVCPRCGRFSGLPIELFKTVMGSLYRNPRRSYAAPRANIPSRVQICLTAERS